MKLVLDLIFFLFIQLVVLRIYYTLRHRKEETFSLYALFPSRFHFLVFNSAIFISCLYLNIKKQLFCVPVAWASILIVLFCLAFLVLPSLQKRKAIEPLFLFFSGIGFFISIYIVAFGRFEYFLFILFHAIIFVPLILVKNIFKKQQKNVYLNALWFYPLFVITPFFILYQLVLIFKSLNRKLKVVFISSSLFLLVIGIALTYQMNTIFIKIAASTHVENDLKTMQENPVNSYLIELILGAHIKYHTELDVIFDGYRPPYHNPILILSNKILFPYLHFAKNTKLYYRQDLYKKLYPNNSLTFNCKCGIDETLFRTEY
ncbi:MAG: hypothetical protein JNJ41_02365 [Bacteroidia bacterium]|nr:hypothetical protein [Bacteroidia bacterium]